MSTFSAYFCACGQQHGGSVCRWETSGGGAWNYRAAGTQQQIILFQSSVLHCRGSEKIDTCICWIFTIFHCHFKQFSFCCSFVSLAGL